MAWTQAEYDALKSAIAGGAKVVRYADGKSVEYHSLADMRSLLAEMEASLNATSNAASRCSSVTFDRG
jgi:hypothetical protein